MENKLNNIDKLIIDKEYTYKELCEILEWKYATGNTKRAQINLLKDHYEVKKEKTKYLIVRKKSQEEILKNTESKVFSSMLCNSLIDWLVAEDSKIVVATYREIMEKNGMVNSKYFPVKYGKETIYIKTPYAVSEEEVENNKNRWMATSEKILRQQIDQSCEKIRKRSLCTIGKTFKLYKKLENGVILSSCASEEQEREILKFQQEGLKLVGAKSLNEIYYLDPMLKMRYREYILAQLRAKLGYDFYANAIKFNVVDDLAHRAEYSRFEINQGAYKVLTESKQITKYIPEYISKPMGEETIDILNN